MTRCVRRGKWGEMIEWLSLNDFNQSSLHFHTPSAHDGLRGGLLQELLVATGAQGGGEAALLGVTLLGGGRARGALLVVVGGGRARGALLLVVGLGGLGLGVAADRLDDLDQVTGVALLGLLLGFEERVRDVTDGIVDALDPALPGLAGLVVE